MAETKEQTKTGVCVGCGGVADRTNNTLCLTCWWLAEGYDE